MFRGGRRAVAGGGGGSTSLGWASINSSVSPYSFSVSSGTNALTVTMTGDLDIMLPSASAGSGLIYTIRHISGSLTSNLLKIKSNGGNVEGNAAGVGVTITSSQSTTRVSSNGTEWLII